MGLLKLFGFESKEEKRLKQIQLTNCVRIFMESCKILQTTDKIETFLSRYEIMIRALEEAQQITGNQTRCFGGVTPREAIQIAQHDLPEMLNACLDKFIQKKTVSICQSTSNRLKKAKALYGLLVAYEDQIPGESLVYWQFLVDRLVKKVERIEKLDAERDSQA